MWKWCVPKVSLNSARLFKGFLVLCGRTPAGKELFSSAFTFQTLFLNPCQLDIFRRFELPLQYRPFIWLHSSGTDGKRCNVKSWAFLGFPLMRLLCQHRWSLLCFSLFLTGVWLVAGDLTSGHWTSIRLSFREWNSHLRLSFYFSELRVSVVSWVTVVVAEWRGACSVGCCSSDEAFLDVLCCFSSFVALFFLAKVSRSCISFKVERRNQILNANVMVINKKATHTHTHRQQKGKHAFASEPSCFSL